MSYPAYCLGCAKQIDVEAAMDAAKNGTEYVHECGRGIVKAKETAPAGERPVYEELTEEEQPQCRILRALATA